VIHPTRAIMMRLLVILSIVFVAGTSGAVLGRDKERAPSEDDQIEAEVDKACALDGELFKEFEKVVTEQLGDAENFMSFKPMYDAYEALTEEEQALLMVLVMELDRFPEYVRTLVAGARSIIVPVLEGQSLAEAFFKDPRSSKHFGRVMKDFVVESSLKMLATQNPIITDGLRSFAEAAVETGNAVYYKLQKVLEAAKETEICGNFDATCPATTQDITLFLASAVADDCTTYHAIGHYGESMGMAMDYIEDAVWELPSGAMLNQLNQLLELETAA